MLQRVESARTLSELEAAMLECRSLQTSEVDRFATEKRVFDARVDDAQFATVTKDQKHYRYVFERIDEANQELKKTYRYGSAKAARVLQFS